MMPEELEDFEEKLAEVVGRLSPEGYERYGPALREAGLAIAEFRQVEHARVEAMETPERAEALEALERVLEDFKRLKERAIRTRRLFEEAE
jgi:hypothetical protein